MTLQALFHAAILAIHTAHQHRLHCPQRTTCGECRRLDSERAHAVEIYYTQAMKAVTAVRNLLKTPA